VAKRFKGKAGWLGCDRGWRAAKLRLSDYHREDRSISDDTVPQHLLPEAPLAHTFPCNHPRSRGIYVDSAHPSQTYLSNPKRETHSFYQHTWFTHTYPQTATVAQTYLAQLYLLVREPSASLLSSDLLQFS